MDIVYDSNRCTNGRIDYSNVWGLINDTAPIRFIKESYEVLLWLSLCYFKKNCDFYQNMFFFK